MFESSLTTQDLNAFLEDYMEYLGWFHIDALPVAHFETIEHKRFNVTSSLWGPGEPSGDGWCGNMLLGQKGWRVNDESCYVNIGFVCQKKKNTSGKETNKIYNSEIKYYFKFYLALCSLTICSSELPVNNYLNRCIYNYYYYCYAI